MGLNDITKEEKYPVGEVQSDRKTVSFPDSWWEALACHHAFLLAWHPEKMKDEEIKFLVSLLDKTIEDEWNMSRMTEDQIEEAKVAREKLVRQLP